MPLRVFPRKTHATPTDGMAYVGYPGLFAPKAEEIHVSVTFTWDLPLAERLARAWEPYGRVSIGGPAMGSPGGSFTPGLYLRRGYVITSRGCPNNCWFCSVPTREGDVRELPITEGWIVQDDNLLACSEPHIRAVFSMLKRQPKRAELRGLEASFLKPWHVDLLADLRPHQMFFAYDTPGDLEPLRLAGRMLQEAGFSFSGRALRCYVLAGYPGDSTEKAESRIWQAVEAGFWPFAMLWRDPESGKAPSPWLRFQKSWDRMAAISATISRRIPHLCPKRSERRDRSGSMRHSAEPAALCPCEPPVRCL